MSKDLWFAEMERLMANGASYESACDRAHGSMMERLYDQADHLRKRAREEGMSLKATATPAGSTDAAPPQASQDTGATKRPQYPQELVNE